MMISPKRAKTGLFSGSIRAYQSVFVGRERELDEVERLLGSNSKITELTGWKPAHSLEEGLMQTIDWFREREKRNILAFPILS